MNVFRTIDEDGGRPVVRVTGRHPVALCPSCSRPSVTTNGSGWRDVIDVVRTVVVTLSIGVRRFVCKFEDCAQHTFDERFEGIGRGGATERALAFFADLQRGQATKRVAIDLGVPQHYLRLAVGRRRRVAHERTRGRLGRRLGIDECSVRKNFVYATVFSDPERGVVIDLRTPCRHVAERSSSRTPPISYRRDSEYQLCVAPTFSRKGALSSRNALLRAPMAFSEGLTPEKSSPPP